MAKRVAALTSGGDAPGMNAALRAIVRSAKARGWQVSGIRYGFAGLLENDFVELGDRDVGGIMNMGGTFLRTARAEEFKTEAGQNRAIRNLQSYGVDALIVIGGDGSLAGANVLCRKGFPVLGLPATIDNDVFGSDFCIGSDTALNIAVEAIDRLKVTALAHERAFLVEVMGRQSGYLALMSCLAGGGEIAVIPEMETSPEAVADELRTAYDRGKAHAIAVVAEGAPCSADCLERYFQEQVKPEFEVRVTRLGYVQRGGAPTVFDRLLATQLGSAAIEFIAREVHGILVGLVHNVVTVTPFDEVVRKKKELDLKPVELVKVLAR
jgi:6-phosphofructokinase 1